MIDILSALRCSYLRNCKPAAHSSLELRLIKNFFPGLRPRPVKLARTLELGADAEASEPNLVLKQRKRIGKELRSLLMHELIHYQLRDQGNVYHGHGAAFLKRAREQVDQWFDRSLEEVGKVPDPYNVKLYPYVQNAYVGWTAFSAAVKEKSDHVLQEIWRVRKGPHVKGLHELQNEYAELQQQRETLLRKLKKQGKGFRMRPVRRQVKVVDVKLKQVRKEIEKDYGISLP